MTRNEFIIKRLKSDAQVYRVTVPILIGCVVLAVVLSVVGLVMGKGVISLGPALLMISIALQIPSFMRLRDDYARAAEQFEAYVADPSVELSERTENLIDKVTHGGKDLKGQTICYLLLGVMLVGMGIFLYIATGVDSSFSQAIRVGLTVLMVGGGLLLLVMGANAYRNLRAFNELASIED